MVVEKCSLLVVLLCILSLLQFVFYSTKILELSAVKRDLEAEIHSMRRKREVLRGQIVNLVDEDSSAESSWENIATGFEDPSASSPIFFITPTTYRPAQKADLTRLGQTLTHVQNVYWIIIEDSFEPSPFIDELMARLGIPGTHLAVRTPPEWRNRFPKGVQQRNAALDWIRKNLRHHQRGIIFFGDDDNVYDWRLFDEMRTIHRIGIWPVGIVDQMLAEYPILQGKSKVIGFNSKWKRNRPFPIDMASFATNLTLVLSSPNAGFSYHTPRGHLESYFLRSLNITLEDFEPKAQNCSKVYVWHTRTEKTELLEDQLAKFNSREGLNQVEKDAIF